MKKQFKREANSPIHAFLYTELLVTDEFEPIVRRGEFVLLDTDASAKEGDLVAVRQKEYPGYFLKYYTKGVDCFAVCVGVGRRLNKSGALAA
jgi:hypothetical protein